MMLAFVVYSLLALRTVAELWLDRLNLRELKRHENAVPEAYRATVSEEEYAKSVDYSKAKLTYGGWRTIWDVLVLAVLLAGVLAALYHAFTGWLGEGLWSRALAVVLTLFVASLPGWPWDWWATFKLEGKYGFNRTTAALWLRDRAVSFLLTLAIGVPLVALLLWFAEALPTTWWLWGFLALLVFQVIMLALYPKLILPLFNKLTPLPEGELRERLVALGERAGFTMTQLQVIDGSKRSTHSNALFTGFGRFRKAILYDTLIEQMKTPELEAVLAHEIGHSKCRHLPKMLAVSAISSLVMFGALGLLAANPELLTPFGFAPGDGVAAVLLFAALAGDVFTFWFSPLTNSRLRKYEYEADAFAKQMLDDDPMPLVSGLRRIHQKNLANLTPHPWYARFHYSHPTLIERERALLG
ncbi:MAG: M48 family metallopeptidase [Opitutales bacterium]